MREKKQVGKVITQKKGKGGQGMKVKEGKAKIKRKDRK